MAREFISASSQYLECTDLKVTTGPITIAIRMIPSALTAFTCAFGIGHNTNGDSTRIEFRVRGDLSDQIEIVIIDIPSGVQSITGNAVTVGQEVALVVACPLTGSGGCRLYQDGFQAGSTTSAGWTGSSQNRMEIGAAMSAGTRNAFFDGILLEAAVWNDVLTQPEAYAYFRKQSPMLIRPSALKHYVPLVNNIQDLKGSFWSNPNNAVQVPHKAIVLPKRRGILKGTATSPPPPPPPAVVGYQPSRLPLLGVG